MQRIQFNIPLLKERRRDLRKRQTEAEKNLWQLLRNKRFKGFKFWRQYSVGPYILDFYCPSKRLAIELDGGQHATEQSMVYDKERTEHLNKRGISVLRFWNNDILRNSEGVLRRIEESFEVSPPNLPLI